MSVEETGIVASGAEAMAALKRFDVDKELLALEERIGRFNIFDALRIARHEIRHSNFLAWLLDPNESHGQGPLFLKAILMDLLRHAPPELRPLSPVELDGEDLRGVEVRREWRSPSGHYIDLLITCKEPPFVIAIENKIDAGPHNPFTTYEHAVLQGHPNTPTIFVYLTKRGDRLTHHPNWLPYSYAKLVVVLDRIHQANASEIERDVVVILNHYISLIRSRVMHDPEIDELCRRIYSEHRRAIDLIVRRSGGRAVMLMRSIEEEVRRSRDWIVSHSHSRSRTWPRLHLRPREWDGLFPTGSGTDRRCEEDWLFCNLGVKGSSESLRWSLVVAPTHDTTLRSNVIATIMRHLDLPEVTRDKQWLTLEHGEIDEWRNGEDDERVLGAVRGKLSELHKRLAGVPDALRPIVAEWEASQAVG